MPNGSGRPGVGIVGVGDIGGKMASSILRRGFDVCVFDLRPEPVDELVDAGAVRCESLEALASRADVICVVVFDDDQVSSVVKTMLPVTRPGSVVVVHSSVRPSTVTHLADAAGEVGVDVIDAPVTGGPEKAERGQLTVLVGGNDDSVRRCRPVLEAMASHVFHVGPTGAGSAAKLANNLLALGAYALQLEAMQLLGAYGIGEDVATTFLIAGGADSRGLRTWGIMDRFRRAHIRLGASDGMYEYMAKDLLDALDAGGERNVSLPLTASVAVRLPAMLRERDRRVQPTEDLPRCGGCGQELAAPFRSAGVHPECVALQPTSPPLRAEQS